MQSYQTNKQIKKERKNKIIEIEWPGKKGLTRINIDKSKQIQIQWDIALENCYLIYFLISIFET